MHWENSRIVIGIAIGTFIPAVIIVALRFLTRIHVLTRRPGADDWIMLVALLSSFFMTIAMCLEAYSGLGRPVATLSTTQVTDFSKYLWISIMTYALALFFTKLSILTSYLHIFPTALVKLATEASIAFVCLVALFTVVSTCVQCIPTAKFWDSSLEGICYNLQGIWISHAVLNILSDIIIFVLPLPVLKSLKIEKRAKMWLMLIFSLGFVVTVISIIRLPLLIATAESKNSDLTLNINAATLSAIEVNVAIICASLPSLRSFLKRYTPRLVCSKDNSSSTNIKSGTMTQARFKGHVRDTNSISKIPLVNVSTWDNS